MAGNGRMTSDGIANETSLRRLPPTSLPGPQEIRSSRAGDTSDGVSSAVPIISESTSDNGHSQRNIDGSPRASLCCNIALGGGRVAWIDQSDYATVSTVKWHAVKATGNRSVWYAQDHNGNRLHIFLLGTRSGFVIDHRDGNGLNCRRSNLRWATPSQNRQNARPRRDNATGFKGVQVSNSGKRFRAVIGVNGKYIGLGTYDTAVDAAIAYDLAAIRFYGEFARTNVLLEVNDGSK